MTLDSGETAELTAVFSTGSTGSGTLTLTAVGNGVGVSDGGSWNVTVNVPNVPTAVAASLINANRGGIDRGLCFTTGAGAAAGASCGDLVITHSMPAYRTMGKDRTLSLLYNSAAARGQLLVAAQVNQPNGSVTASKLTAVLRVAGQRDSVDYAAVPAGTTAQIVVGDRLPHTIATGVYLDTLVLRNTYPAPGPVLETTLVDTVVVVNNRTSQYGQGWSLVGVEQLLFAQPAGTQDLLWVGGDGSALRYHMIAANKWVAPAAGYRDTITYNAATAKYTRFLRHNAQVVYSAQGYHLQTINRYAQVTSITYDTLSWIAGDVGVSAQRQKIAVPGNDGVVRQYVLYSLYSNTIHSFLLDSIADPGGRMLRVSRSGTLVTAIADPDGQQTQFVYGGPDSLLSARKVPNPAVAGGWSQTTYAYAGRSKLTRARAQAGPTGLDSTVVKYAPWQVNGLDTIVTGLTAPVIPVSPLIGFPSTVDGPIAGTGDQLSVWMNQFGQPTRTLLEGTGAVTDLYRDSTSMPVLVTRIRMPHLAADTLKSRWVKLSYNARANLVMQRDITFAIDSQPDQTSQWVYGNASFPDTPTRITDPMGRSTLFTLDEAFGVPALVQAPSGHRTAFSYYPVSGLVQSVSDSAVETWIQAAGTDSLRTLTTTFEYNGMGQVQKTTSPTGAVTVWQSDSVGQVVSQWGPDSLKLSFYYDRIGRDTLVTTATGPSANFLGAASTCRAAEFVCGVHATPWTAGIPVYMATRTYHGPVGVDSVVTDRSVPRGFAYDAAGNQARESDDSARAIKRFVGATQLLDSTESRSHRHVRNTYDGIGRLVRMSYDSTISWQVVADTNGVTVSLPDTIPGDTINYSYDIEGRIRSSSGSLATGGVTRTYWANGLLRTKVSTQPFTDSLSYWYDASGAVVKKAHVSFNLGAYAYRMQDTTTYTYDAVNGRLVSQTTTLVNPTGVPSQTLQYQWDALDRRRAVIYPGNKTAQYRYDAGGVVRAIWTTGTPCNALTVDNFCVSVMRDSVDLRGRILSQETICSGDPIHDGYACGTLNAVRRSSRYYPNGWLASQVTEFTSDSLAYDASGNIVRRWRQNDQHWHDLLYFPRTNRVQVDTVEHGPSEAALPLGYHYTADGGRTFERVSGARNLAKQLERDYGYDGLGRTRGFGSVTWDGGVVYHHNYSHTACQYDAEGRMVQACKASAGVAYDGDNVAAASDYQWHFVQGPSLDDPLIGFGQTFPGGTVYVVYWVNDGAGGSLSNSLADGSWTNVLNQATGGDGQGWQQAGGARNAGTYSPDRQGNANAPQIAFFRNRVYDMQSGQWTQEDPAGLAGGVNLYQYAGSNPVAFSDPFGLCYPHDSNPCTWRDVIRLQPTFGGQASASIETPLLGAGVRVQAGRVMGLDLAPANGQSPDIVKTDNEASCSFGLSSFGESGGFKLDALSDDKVLTYGENVSTDPVSSGGTSTQRNGFNQEIKINVSVGFGLKIYIDMNAITDMQSRYVPPQTDAPSTTMCAKVGLGC